jgi:hypothetical protein
MKRYSKNVVGVEVPTRLWRTKELEDILRKTHSFRLLVKEMGSEEKAFASIFCKE